MKCFLQFGRSAVLERRREVGGRCDETVDDLAVGRKGRKERREGTAGGGRDSGEEEEERSDAPPNVPLGSGGRAVRSRAARPVHHRPRPTFPLRAVPLAGRGRLGKSRSEAPQSGRFVSAALSASQPASD